ncbi:MAG: hypothetical protein J6N21_01490 [Butyrivibrio sp.]|nr:hypothetical protein [Butyrivibrio sp.]
MRKTIEDAFTTERSIVDAYVFLYKKLLSARNEKDYLVLQQIIENSHFSFDKEAVSSELEEKTMILGAKYFGFMQEYVHLIARDNPCQEAFYQQIYNEFFCSDLFKLSDMEYGIILFFLSRSVRGLPYYQAVDTVKMSDEQFSETADAIRPELNKAYYMLDDRFDSLTEEASQLYNISEKIEDKNKVIVFWASVIGRIRKTSEKGDGSKRK